MTELRKQIGSAAKSVRKHSKIQPSIGIILGTGLNGLAAQIDSDARVSYEDIPHFPKATVHTHAGELILGRLGGKDVIALSGRLHAYEGYTLQQVTFPVRVAKALGIRALIVSNAAGGLNPQFAAGDLMVITDHINFMGDNPLIGPNDDELGPRFPDMSEPYSREMVALAESVAMKKGIKLQRGVYLACPGPSLETRAEYRFMRFLGADAVGMSTVPEVIVAVHSGLKVLGFSAITDECSPDALKPVNIEKIIAIANRIEPRLTEIVAACVERMKI
ncbi:MAG: purine-nucleoside phosphorylase [Candidatus Hydrogenedentes bacterium]|nr:purine-nucleoside phosphorylase [Candidatus Hydrogenedentota bacterium]